VAEKETLRVKAYEYLKTKIIFFDLKPGNKIFEDEISENLKISRTPVREALLMLEKEGLVQCDDRLGFIVRKLSYNEVEEYFSIRIAIETFGVPLITERITHEEIELLEKNIHEAEFYLTENNNFRNLVRLETEFHEILYKTTKSVIYFETISTLIDKFQWLRAIALNAPGGARLSINDHKRMLNALKKKDTKELKKLTKLHLQHAKKKYSLNQGLFV